MSDARTAVYLGVLVVGLFALAFFLPDNGISGYVISEPSCGALGCTELCDLPDGVCSATPETCCSTNWGTGVCDLEQNCPTIQSYSERMSLTQYQDTVRETPGPVGSDWARFLTPLLVIGGIAVYVVMSGRSKKRMLR